LVNDDQRLLIHVTLGDPTPSDLSTKTFWDPKFELPVLKILTTWNVHMAQIVQFQFAILQLYIGLWRISSHCNKMLIEKRRCTCTLVQ